MTTKHTPGPWFVALTPFVIGHRGHLDVFVHVANASPDTGPVQQAANARLIAAAPDLLEAAKALLSHIYEMSSNDHATLDETLYDGAEGTAVRNAIEAAIAKAEGKP